MSLVADVRRALNGENLSSPSGAKWSATRELIANALGIDADEVYCTYMGKSTQAQVRLGKQIRANIPYRVALAFGGDGKRDATSYHTHAKAALTNFPSLEAVVLFFEEGGAGSRSWSPERVYFKQGSDLIEQIRNWSAAAVCHEVDSGSVRAPGVFAQRERPPLPDTMGTELARVFQLLHGSKNVLLRGVPGVGKTFLCRSVIERWQDGMGRPLAAHRVLVMHAAATYEDLVEGLRPNCGQSASSFRSKEVAEASGDFVPRLGRITEFVKCATEDPARDFLLVLDEINRTNMASAFGELLLLAEASKRATWDPESQDWKPPLDGQVLLTYSGRSLFVPENLFIVATMNSSDRSISPMDRATLRRFASVRLEPLEPSELGPFLQTGDQLAIDAFEDCIAVWSAMNDAILYPHVGPDAVIGHSALIGLAARLSRSSEPAAAAASFLESDLLSQVAHALTEVGQEDLLLSGKDRDERVASTHVVIESVLAKYGLRVEVSGTGLGRKISVERA